MKVIIAGSRTVSLDHGEIDKIVEESGFEVTELVNGCHWEGVDHSAMEWAHARGTPVRRFPANWKEKGKAAGPLRNALMAEYAEALIAVWDGESKGTQNMIKEAKKHGLKIHIVKQA